MVRDFHDLAVIISDSTSTPEEKNLAMGELFIQMQKTLPGKLANMKEFYSTHKSYEITEEDEEFLVGEIIFKIMEKLKAGDYDKTESNFKHFFWKIYVPHFVSDYIDKMNTRNKHYKVVDNHGYSSDEGTSDDGDDIFKAIPAPLTNQDFEVESAKLLSGILLKAFNNAMPRHRIYFISKLIIGLKFEDISYIFNVPEGTLKTDQYDLAEFLAKNIEGTYKRELEDLMEDCQHVLNLGLNFREEFFGRIKSEDVKCIILALKWKKDISNLVECIPTDSELKGLFRPATLKNAETLKKEVIAMAKKGISEMAGGDLDKGDPGGKDLKKAERICKGLEDASAGKKKRKSRDGSSDYLHDFGEFIYNTLAAEKEEKVSSPEIKMEKAVVIKKMKEEKLNVKGFAKKYKLKLEDVVSAVAEESEGVYESCASAPVTRSGSVGRKEGVSRKTIVDTFERIMKL